MNIKNTRAIIIGIMTLFIISSFNPLFINNTKATNLDGFKVSVNPSEVFECSDFTVSATFNEETVSASIDYYEGGEGTGASVVFEAASVDADKGILVPHTVYAHYKDENNVSYSDETTIYVKNRYLEITNPGDTVDGGKFNVHIDEKGNSKVWGGATVSINFPGGASRLTGTQGNTITKFDAPIHKAGEGNQYGYIEYTITATKDDFISADPVGKVFVKNINIAPNTPSKPQADGIIDRFYVGKVVNLYTSTDDPDVDDVKYEFFWGDGTSSESGYVPSGESITLGHTYEMKVPGNPKEVYIMAQAEDNGVNELGNPDPLSSSKSLPQMIKLKNNAPVLAQVSGSSEFEGNEASLTFTGKDGEENHPIYFDINWGDNTPQRYPSSGYIDSGSSKSLTHTYSESKEYCVSMTVNDKYGKSKVSNSHCIVVGNLKPNKPSLSVSKMGKGAFQAHVTTTDPNAEDTFSLYINWNDEHTASSSGHTNSNNGFSDCHTFTTTGLKKITAWAIDQDGEPSDIATKRVFCLILDLTLADAAMPMNIDVNPLPTVQPISNMVPKTFINENGEVERIDDSFSVNSYSDGTYGLQQNGQTVQQGFQSAEEVQNYAATYVPSDNEDNNNDGSNSNNDNSDDNSDDSNDEQDESEEDNADNEEDEEDPVSYPTVYSISNYKEPSEWVDDADEKDEDSKDSEPTKEDDQDGEIQNENTIDVTVRFDGSGTLVPLYAQADQETPVSSASIEIQSEEASENSGKMIGISSFFQSLIKIFPALTKLNIIKQILQVETPNTDDVESKEITDEDEEQITPSETNIPPEEENIVEDIPDTSPIDTDESEEENENPSETNAFSDEENTENNDETNDITEDPVVSEDSEDEDLIVTEDMILDLLEEENIVFLWDFGDGTAATGITPTHTYHITIEGESSVETDKETSTGKLSINSFSTIPNPGNEMPVEAIDENAENFDTKYATYQVTLFIVIDEQGILKNIESIDKNILSQVEIISQDKTTVTIGEISSGPSLDGIVQQVQLSGMGDLYSGLSLLAF